MSILAQVFSPQLRATETIKQITSSIFGLPVFNASASLATPHKALTLSAYYNAVDLLSDDIAKLPKHIFTKDGENRNTDNEHHVNYLLSIRPNPKMTPFTFWKTVELLRLHKGNCYVQKIKNNQTGLDVAWYIRKNEDVKVLENENDLFYEYKGKVYTSDDWLHFKGFTLDGKIGVGVVTYAAAQMGISLENQAYGNTIFKNRGLSYGVIESDNEIADPNKKLISEGFTSKLAEQNPHKAPVLDEGLKYKAISITPAEAQFLETNKQGTVEVCKWLNIAPHKLKDLTNANYSNIYQQSIEHVQDSVLPRVIQIEQELSYKIFSQAELFQKYVKFNIASLLRGDLDAKAKFYTAMVYAGIYTRNEVRKLEDKNPINGLSEPLQPVNMQALSMANQIIKEQNNGSN